MFYNNIKDTREIFFSSWNKYKQNQALSLLEQQIVKVILVHPEYHTFLKERSTVHSFSGPEDNPFLHMGLHLAVRDQLKIDRPCGISEVYYSLLFKYKEELSVEHLMMEQLFYGLLKAQNEDEVFNERVYVENLKQLLNP